MFLGVFKIALALCRYRSFRRQVTVDHKIANKHMLFLVLLITQLIFNFELGKAVYTQLTL